MTTLERMARIETSIDYIKKNLDEQTRKTDELVEKIDGFIQKAERRYATKEELLSVEKKIRDHSNNTQSWIKASIPWFLAAMNLAVAIVVIIQK